MGKQKCYRKRQPCGAGFQTPIYQVSQHSNHRSDKLDEPLTLWTMSFVGNNAATINDPDTCAECSMIGFGGSSGICSKAPIIIRLG